MAVLEPYKADYYLWKYLPSVPAAAIFASLFILAFFAHSWQIHKERTKFCIPFALGCFFEIVGYIARAAASKKTGKLMPYIIQNFFILVAPALFAASIYMTLGRIIRSVNGEHLSLIRVGRLTKTFVIGDVMSFMIQGGSAGLMFNSSTVKMGEMMVIAGLAVQIIMFGLFAVTALMFQRKLKSQPTPISLSGGLPWKQSLHMLYTISALIMVRSVFRVIEYVMGQDGYPLKHEWTLYIFDSVLMFMVTVIFYLRYPSQLEGCAGDVERLRMVTPGKSYESA